MVIPLLLFYIFAIILVVSAIAVVSVKNPVHSILFLILAFFNAAGIFLLQGAEFLAMLLVIIYVGAVAVLFLFVVMMLNINFAKMKEGAMKHLPLGMAIALILLTEIIVTAHYLLTNSSLVSYARENISYPQSDKLTNTEQIGRILYTDYIYHFQMSGVILLVAMIGAVVLTHRVRKNVKKQNISKQVSRSRSESVKLVKVLTGKGI